jgi:hypothetical protein
MSLSLEPFIVGTIAFALRDKVAGFKGDQQQTECAARAIYRHMRLSHIKCVVEGRSLLRQSEPSTRL